MTLCDKGGILNFVTSHFKNSIKTTYLSLIYRNFWFFNVLFIFILMFDLMLIFLKNNLNGNKNNFGTAVLI